jgi:two-component system response regulator TctD
MPVEKGQLFSRVFDHDSEASLDAIEVVLHRLRKKLAGSDVHIVTVRGLGYMLESIDDDV